MELLALDAAFIDGAVVAIRWARVRPVRVLPLAAAIGAATVFATVRNHYKLEDSAFFLALAVSCSLAGAIAAAACVPLRQGARSASVYATLAVGLVPAIFIADLALRFTVCLITGCDLS